MTPFYTSAEARRRGRKGGRPPAFKAADVTAARALMREGKLPVRDVAKRMGVSVATLYRHVGSAAPTTALQTSRLPMPDRSKRPPGEALVDLRRRLALLSARDPARTEVVARAAEAYGVSVWTIYRALRDLTRPKSVRRSDHGSTRAMPAAGTERYAEIVAALKIRTANKKGRHLSTARAIRLLEEDGVETPDGLLKRATWDCPVLVDGLRTWDLRVCFCCLHACFVGHGRAVSQGRVQPDWVIPALDVAEAGDLRFGLGGKPTVAQQLGFQGREEAFRHGVVVGVAVGT